MILPALNYDSDLGVGIGATASIARFETGAYPYRWRVQAQAFSSIKQEPNGFDVPFHNHFVRLDIPGAFDGLMRLQLRAAFKKFSNSGYYGLGSRATRTTFTGEELESSQVARQFYFYDRIYPRIDANARIPLYRGRKATAVRMFELLLGLSASYSTTTIYSGSRLEQDYLERQMATPDGQTLAALLHGFSDHVLLLMNLGVLYDTRDHELVPSEGTFTELSIRFSPGVSEDLLYAGAYFSSAWYATLIPRRLIIASRVAADLLIGDPPFYELSQMGVLRPYTSPGGASSLRGILRQRFHGKIKLLLNMEVRFRLRPVHMFGHQVQAGITAFADTGRVFADYVPQTLDGQPLDGSFSAFDLGLGGGIRVQWGEAFLLRIDAAYAPTDDTMGFYVQLGHLF